MRKNRIALSATALLTLLGLAPAGAQLLDLSKYPDIVAQWHRPAGIGIQWDQTKRGGPPQQAPLTPEYQALYRTNLADQAAGGQGADPTGRCIPPGMPRMMTVVFPMEIVILPNVTYVLTDYTESRRIYTDGRDWPKELESTFNGYSIGRWIDQDGDGRYDVEYRVRQPDGSWRWLSAWGLVEFEGEGENRKPVAIAGASRDLTERKQGEQLQRMLLDELNHRVKNTLATVHAITAQTLRIAADLTSARETLEQRIISMGKAHDLLTARTWAGADLAEVVTRALEAFPPEQVRLAGPSIDLSSRHVLALSMALHELATNATKYGALSCAGGSVSVTWEQQEDVVRLTWEEAGGPPVAAPASQGFGGRLLRQLVRDLGGTIDLDFAPNGVRCVMTAAL